MIKNTSDKPCQDTFPLLTFLPPSPSSSLLIPFVFSAKCLRRQLSFTWGIKKSIFSHQPPRTNILLAKKVNFKYQWLSRLHPLCLFIYSSFLHPSNHSSWWIQWQIICTLLLQLLRLRLVLFLSPLSFHTAPCKFLLSHSASLISAIFTCLFLFLFVHRSPSPPASLLYLHIPLSASSKPKCPSNSRCMRIPGGDSSFHDNTRLRG